MLVVGLALAALNLLVYASVWRHDFVNFDDPQYMTENLRVSAGLTWDGVRWALTTGHAGNWHPLTWFSHMLDVELFGVKSGPQHAVNLALHIANTLVLFGLLWRMTGAVGRSAFVAALFAAHPLHVESVAWISERKDVLSTLFWLLTLWAYVAYARSGRWTWYGLALLCLALGLMSKPMLVTVPCVLLLLDYWPLRRPLGLRLVFEKLPFFALVAVSSFMTFRAQSQGGAVSALAALPLATRLANALFAYLGYIEKMVWPTGLTALYPYSRSGYGWVPAVSIALLTAISVFVGVMGRRHRYLAVGWLWYLGTLVPVIGLVQVGVQSMADRYTYVPLIGLFIMIAWGVVDLVPRLANTRVALPAAALIVIAACAATARTQVAYWHDSETLWRHAVRVHAANAHAETALGSVLEEQGKTEEANALFLDALRIEPDFAEAHNKLGVLLANQGRVNEAILQYEAAVRLKPSLPEPHYNLGNARAAQGKPREAISNYLEALRLRPDDPAAHNGLGSALDDEGKTEDAIAQYLEALRLNPQLADAHNNLGAARAKQGRTDEAILEFLDAIRIKPNYADAHYNVAIVLNGKGRTAEALQHLREALRLKPNHEGARQALQVIGGRGAP